MAQIDAAVQKQRVSGQRRIQLHQAAEAKELLLIHQVVAEEAVQHQSWRKLSPL
jgi:hypothetical protein